MVLKKSKWAGKTGNTQRKYPKQSICDKKAAHITLVRSPELGLRQDGRLKQRLSQNENSSVGVSMTLNKKKRWMITEELEENMDALSTKKTFTEQDDIKSQSYGKKRMRARHRKNQTGEQSAPPPKIAVFDTVRFTQGKCCRAVYSLDEDNPGIIKGKKWKTRKETMTEDCYDETYEIESEVPSSMWPYNVHSARNSDLVKDKTTRKCHYLRGNKHTNDNNLIHEDLDDWSRLYDDEQYEMDLEGSLVIEGNEDIEANICLGDFMTKKFQKKKKERFSTYDVKNRNERISIEDLSKDFQKDNVIYIEVDEELRNFQMQEIEQQESTEKETQQDVFSSNQHLIGASDSAMLECQEFDVVVSTSSILHNELKSIYGNKYTEATVIPRCFGVFIDKVLPTDAMTGYTCFVVVNQTCESKTDGTSLVKIRMFSNGPKFDMAQLEQIQGTVLVFDQIISSIKKDMSFIPPVRCNSSEKMVSFPTRKLTKWQTKSYNVLEAFNLLANEVFAVTSGECDMESDVSCDLQVVSIYCQICYQQLADPFLPISEKSGMHHKNCLHSFCRGCWQSHLTTRIEMQTPVITCPGFDCKSEVDIATILSTVKPDKAKVFIKTVFERNLAAARNWEWCPTCEKAAFCHGYQGVKGPSALGDIPVVKCQCNTTWCFECKEEQHWPATCDSVREYRNRLEKVVGSIFDSNGRFYVTEVELKPCPLCKTPINKSQGCNYMTCRCGRSFCWNCLLPFPNHSHDTCKYVPVKMKTFTSVGVFLQYGDEKLMKKALEYRFQITELLRSKTKLGLGRQSTHVSKIHPEGSKEALLKRVFGFAISVNKMLEYLVVTRKESKSKHYRRRICQFFDVADFLLKCLTDELSGNNIKTINMKEVMSFSKQLDTHVQNLKGFGL